MFPFLPILGSVLGGLFASSSANKAANAQTTAAQNDLAFQQEQFDTIQANLAPYLQGGNAANAALMFELGLGPKPQNYAGFSSTPGYDFRMGQGQDAIQASAAAQGGLNSGSTMKALNSFGQDYASSEYGNYLARLGGQQGVGLNAGAMQGQAGQNLAAGASNAFNNIGNAQSAGAIGQSNALNSTVQDMTSIWAYQNALKQPNPAMTAPQSGSGYSYSPF